MQLAQLHCAHYFPDRLIAFKKACGRGTTPAPVTTEATTTTTKAGYALPGYAMPYPAPIPAPYALPPPAPIPILPPPAPIPIPPAPIPIPSYTNRPPPPAPYYPRG
ncbi:unnamed protein product [Bursaphelenchus xylophilus]|uniref:(pine wood nematode) hypothetical protein n=1 Tax=Bursaphelenchus xylophilus TaxID=6326 RepID=A0A1I7S6Q7_BURXY|nr:unnamed protein product [Bursaphelenchus xylophilus]CAG9120681.1 unnamed protein product [Bursaphelenchus xylophilus]